MSDTFISNQRFLEVKISDYERVSNLIKFMQDNRSPTKKVETPNDWKVVQVLYDFWKKEQPLEHAFFLKSIQNYSNAYYGTGNEFAEMIHQETGQRSKMEIRHVLEIPERFYHVFTSVYPNQDWDKPFIRQLLKEIPELRMLDKTNI